MTDNHPTGDLAVAAADLAPTKKRPPLWRLALGVLMTGAILVLAFLKRAWLHEAFRLAEAAQPAWLLLGLVTIVASFLISSQVFQVVLRALGHRLGVLRLWATAVVAIVTSQVIPAGGVGSYAFLLQSLRRRGVAPAEAALVATLEALSYAGGMLVLFGFGLGYLIVHTGIGATQDNRESLLAAGVALLVIGGAIFVLTRDQAVLLRWLLPIKNGLARLLRQSWSDAPIHRLVEELARGRALIAARRGERRQCRCEDDQRRALPVPSASHARILLTPAPGVRDS